MRQTLLRLALFLTVCSALVRADHADPGTAGAIYEPQSGEIEVHANGVARITLFSAGGNLLPDAGSRIGNFGVALIDNPDPQDLTWLSLSDNIGLVPGLSVERGAVLKPGTPCSDLQFFFQVAGAPVNPGGFFECVIPPGDLDGNGSVDAADIDLLTAAIRDGSTDVTLDLDGSGIVDEGDVTFLVETILNTNFGDADLNGSVTATDDGAILLSNFGGVQGDKGWADGDFNGDLSVTAGVDGALLLDNLTTDTATVPEPNACLLLLCGVCAALVYGVCVKAERTVTAPLQAGVVVRAQIIDHAVKFDG